MEIHLRARLENVGRVKTTDELRPLSDTMNCFYEVLKPLPVPLYGGTYLARQIGQFYTSLWSASNARILYSVGNC